MRSTREELFRRMSAADLRKLLKEIVEMRPWQLESDVFCDAVCVQYFMVEFEWHRKGGAFQEMDDLCERLEKEDQE